MLVRLLFLLITTSLRLLQFAKAPLCISIKLSGRLIYFKEVFERKAPPPIIYKLLLLLIITSFRLVQLVKALPCISIKLSGKLIYSKVLLV